MLNSAVRAERSLLLRRTVRRVVHTLVVHALLLTGGVILLAPFAWLISGSLKEPGQIFVLPPVWIPNPVRFDNYPRALTILPFHLFFRNTMIVASMEVLGTVLSSTLVGYGFARLRFPGRNFLFVLLLSTMMLPWIVTLIPRFILFKLLGWVDTLLPLFVPAFFGGSPFYIFLTRQFFMTIPFEIEEAARVDGAHYWRIWWQIMLPLSKPLLATIVIFTFIHAWNDFMGPLVFLNSMDRRTVALGLATFKGLYSTEWNLMMAASTVATLPILILFFFCQRYFMRGIVMTGLAGR